MPGAGWAPVQPQRITEPVCGQAQARTDGSAVGAHEVQVVAVGRDEFGGFQGRDVGADCVSDALGELRRQGLLEEDRSDAGRVGRFGDVGESAGVGLVVGGEAGDADLCEAVAVREVAERPVCDDEGVLGEVGGSVREFGVQGVEVRRERRERREVRGVGVGVVGVRGGQLVRDRPGDRGVAGGIEPEVRVGGAVVVARVLAFVRGGVGRQRVQSGGFQQVDGEDDGQDGARWKQKHARTVLY